MTSHFRLSLKTLGLIATVIWLASDSRYFTTWFAGVWGIIVRVFWLIPPPERIHPGAGKSCRRIRRPGDRGSTGEP